jgi:hypothetical protein
MQPSNLLTIDSLNEAWCDKDEVMLHDCFQLLCDCIEKENLFNGQIDWDQDGEHREAKQERTALYQWWSVRKFKDRSIHSLSPSQYERDNEMLIKLITLRRWLWT